MNGRADGRAGGRARAGQTDRNFSFKLPPVGTSLLLQEQVGQASAAPVAAPSAGASADAQASVEPEDPIPAASDELVKAWDLFDVESWMVTVGLEDLIPVFINNGINGDCERKQNLTI